MPAEGGERREICTQLASARYPIWSPDSERILFLGEENSDRKTEDWYVIARNGGVAVKTGAIEALRAAGLRASFPIPGAWSARDHEVVFAMNESDSSNVWQIPISPANGRVDGRPERLTFGIANERSPMVANDGRIAFVSVAENVAVWRVPVDASSGQAAGPIERVTEGATGDTLRDVSANGQLVFFISSRTKRDEMWVKDLSTGRERQLTNAGVEEASASPDGSRVAFSRTANGRRRIEIADTAGGLPSTICDDCVAPAGWSHDGKRLLYTAAAPFRLLQYDFSSHKTTEVARHATWSLQRARFSPDDRWITFHTANSPNVRQIYSAPARLRETVPQQSWIPRGHRSRLPSELGVERRAPLLLLVPRRRVLPVGPARRSRDRASRGTASRGDAPSSSASARCVGCRGVRGCGGGLPLHDADRGDGKHLDDRTAERQ